MMINSLGLTCPTYSTCQTYDICFQQAKHAASRPIVYCITLNIIYDVHLTTNPTYIAKMQPLAILIEKLQLWICILYSESDQVDVRTDVDFTYTTRRTQRPRAHTSTSAPTHTHTHTPPPHAHTRSHARAH